MGRTTETICLCHVGGLCVLKTVLCGMKTALFDVRTVLCTMKIALCGIVVLCNIGAIYNMKRALYNMGVLYNTKSVLCYMVGLCIVNSAL